MITQYYIPSKLQGIVKYILERRMDKPGQFTFFPSWECEILLKIKDSKKITITSSDITFESKTMADHFCFITGLTTAPAYVKYEKLNYISVVMNPIALKALFRIPAHELNNIAIIGKDYIPNLNETEDRLNNLPNFYDKAKWLEENIINWVNESAELKTAFGIYNLLVKISNENYSYSSKQVEEMLGYSKTQSFRIFNEWFGLSISKFQKLMNFINTVEHIHKSNDSLTQIGFDLGYYDQAHFIRTFKEFTGITPKQYLKLKTDTPGIFPI